MNGDKIEQAELSKQLSHLYAQADFGDDFIVQISADGDLPVARLQQVFKQVELAGLTRVFLVTKLKQAS